jgi:hypothetical protein
MRKSSNAASGWMKRGIIVTLLACAALGLGLALLAP